MATSAVRRAAWCALLLALAGGGVQAQELGRGRSWRKGDIRMEEIGRQPFNGKQSSHLEYDVSYRLGGIDEGMDSYIYCRTSALIYPAASWMADGHRTEAELNYMQTIFDIVEVHRRQMEREALLLSRRVQYDRLAELTRERVNREVEALRAASDNGRDSAVVELVRRQNRRWLNEHPGGKPDFELLPYWWSLGLTLGFAVPAGGLAEHWSATVGSLGMDYAFGWGRFGFYFSYSSGIVYDRMAQQTEDPAYGYTGMDYTSRTDFNYLGIGYTVLDRPGFTLTPYLSLGLSDFYWDLGAAYTVGVRANRLFHHWHSIKNGAKGKGHRLTVAASGNLYFSYINMGGHSSGPTFGLQLGLSFINRRERVSYR